MENKIEEDGNLPLNMSFENFYEKYYDMFFKFSKRRIKNNDSCLDMVQDTFLSIYKNFDYIKILSKSSALKYAYIVLKNKIIDLSRLKKRHVYFSDFKEIIPDDEDSIKKNKNINKFYYSSYPSPVDSCLIHDEYEKLIKKVEKLIPIYREIINDFYIEGLNTKQITEKEHITIGVATSRLCRARRALLK